jgi:hypothetical protein
MQHTRSDNCHDDTGFCLSRYPLERIEIVGGVGDSVFWCRWQQHCTYSTELLYQGLRNHAANPQPRTVSYLGRHFSQTLHLCENIKVVAGAQIYRQIDSQRLVSLIARTIASTVYNIAI